MRTKTCSSHKETVLVKLPDSRHQDEELARLARAIAHPVRARIVRVLAKRKTCVCGDLVDEFSLAQSTVSQHLKILKETGLVQGEVDGPRVCYCIVRGEFKKLKKLIGEL